MKKTLIKKRNARKIRLIKKYARIRFERFWSEWGLTKEDVINCLGLISIFASLGMLYIIGCMF